ncbi:MAG: hypothetical protein ACFFDK_07120 [Promethearchaeota archaeon]
MIDEKKAENKADYEEETEDLAGEDDDDEEEDEEEEFGILDDDEEEFRLIDDDENFDDDEDFEDNKSIEEKKSIFVPVIQGSDVIELKINGELLPLRTKVSFEKFSQKLMPLLLELQKFIDLENLTLKKKTKNRSSRVFSEPWDKDSLYSFWSALNEKQKEFVKIVYENEEISRNNLIKDLIKENILIKDDPKLKNNLAGLSAGLSRKWNNLKLEPLWNIIKNKYVMNQKPLKVLIDFFDNLEE